MRSRYCQLVYFVWNKWVAVAYVIEGVDSDTVALFDAPFAQAGDELADNCACLVQ